MKKTLLLSGVLGVSVLLAFQNCGKPGSSYISTESASTDPANTNTSPPPSTPNPPTATAKFLAGESYSKAKLPYTPQGRLVADADNYGNVLGIKAMAIAQNGFGIGVGNTAFANQAEANRVVLDACQILSSNSKCAIFAEGNVIKYNEADFYTAMVAMPTGARAFDGKKVPMLLSATGYYTTPANYSVGGDNFKAFAIGLYGRHGHGTGATQAEADRRALQTCEAMDGGLCTLYAQGDNVVWNVNAFSWNTTTASLIYGPVAFNSANIPFLRAVDRANVETFYAARGTNFYVLALGRYGQYYGGVSASQNAAQQMALNQCNLNVANDYSCMVYSINAQVVWTLTDVKANNSAAVVWAQ